MARYSLQRGAEGLDMEDGTHYDADRSGHVTIDNPAHQRAVERSEHAQRQWLGKQAWAFGGASRQCCCGFAAFSWQSECPRCHRPLVEMEA